MKATNFQKRELFSLTSVQKHTVPCTGAFFSLSAPKPLRLFRKLEYVYCLVLLKHHSISETGYFPLLRWKVWGYNCWVRSDRDSCSQTPMCFQKMYNLQLNIRRIQWETNCKDEFWWHSIFMFLNRPRYLKFRTNYLFHINLSKAKMDCCKTKLTEAASVVYR